MENGNRLCTEDKQWETTNDHPQECHIAETKTDSACTHVLNEKKSFTINEVLSDLRAAQEHNDLHTRYLFIMHIEICFCCLFSPEYKSDYAYSPFMEQIYHQGERTNKYLLPSKCY